MIDVSVENRSLLADGNVRKWRPNAHYFRLNHLISVGLQRDELIQ